MNAREPTPLRQGLRRAGLGRLWYHLWHRPRSELAASLREGGPIGQWRTAAGRRAMESAAATLPPLPAPGDAAPTLHLLTGRRFWYQTAFCLHTFARAAGEPVRAELYDDGTIDAQTAALLQRLGPAIRIHPQAAVVARLDRHLPANRFPTLRERWRHYPNIRKLTDIHAGGEGAKLVIDSDLLFFRKPQFLLQWLREPGRPLHAVDCEESYGYTRPLTERLAGRPLPPRVNVGLCGLRSESVDWSELEGWCAELIAREGTSYYLEQALVAMIAARHDCAVAPAEDYVTRPEPREASAPTAVMHHYVANSKRWYFRQNWRGFAA